MIYERLKLSELYAIPFAKELGGESDE